MINRGISIRTRLFLATLATLFLLVLLLISILDTANRLDREQEMIRSRSTLLLEMRSLEQVFHQLDVEGDRAMLSECLGHARSLESRIAVLGAEGSRTGGEQLIVVTGQALTTLNQFMADLHIPVQPDPAVYAQARADLLVLGNLVDVMNGLLGQGQDRTLAGYRAWMIVALGLGIFLIGLYLGTFAINLHRALASISDFAGKLRSGILPPPVEIYNADELNTITGNLNEHAAGLREKINHINALSGEGPVPEYRPEEEDELGNALVRLSETLSRRDLEEVTRNRQDKKQNWISEGVAQMGEVLRMERENVADLSFAVIQKLVKYMGVEMGSFFIANHSEAGKPVLELTASYAYDRRKYLSAKLEWGEGLPGTCAQEMKRIFLTEVPEDYFMISSGTGSVKPHCLLLVPMIDNDVVIGVIELATAKLLRDFEIEFVESLAESIASTLLAVQTSERTSELLKMTQAQAQALKAQESVMLEGMKKLEEAQSESGRRQGEITGILNAMDHSVLVAEFGLNARFSRVNDLFLLALEMPREQVLGKLHSEFAHEDPYSEEYKAFWSSLREGKTVSRTEMYKLYSGKDIWLSQTFTPIRNPAGKVQKILDIAIDVTENRALQEKLESSKQEITRGSLDMQTLKEAVNTALIKCELDAEGIIMDVNEKYTEVTGYGRKELLGRSYRLFLKDTEKDQFEKIWQEVTKEKVYEGVIRRSRPTGEEVWLVSIFSPVINEQGVIYKVYFMGLDITEKKLKYQLLDDANQEIDRLRDRLGQYET